MEKLEIHGQNNTGNKKEEEHEPSFRREGEIRLKYYETENILQRSAARRITTRCPRMI